ncbi:cuticle protein-like [Condylostylus longicornis]|uniref:cuticle protein-like n=1 Tax=Condylostylus longicornis TaxID=2530218 RepID=UPI00244E00AC|nr:cuticle protein-like [Condylostylus longicornis]
MFKFITLFVFIGIASAQHYAHGPLLGHYAAPAVVKAVAPVVKYAAPAIVKQVEYDAPAHYDFSYSVHDEHTGDIKSQQESRQGDVVHGSYSLIDADGFHRIVEYTSDAHNGFNAVVRREPLGHKVVKAVAPIAKVIAPAPVYHAPVAHYAAPIAKVAYAAPVAKVAYAAPAAHVAVHAPAYAYHH